LLRSESTSISKSQIKPELFTRIARAKKDGYLAELDEAEKLRETAFSAFATYFWSPSSQYIQYVYSQV